MLINLFALVLLGGIGVGMLWWGNLLLKVSKAEAQVDQDIAARGVDGNAEIVNHRMVLRSRGAASHYITYQFTPAGQSQAITQETAVSSGNYYDLQIGSHIPIRYLPDNPKNVSLGPDIHETYGASSMNLSGVIVMVLGVGLIIAGFAMFIGFTSIDNNKAATATAETIQLSATPDVDQMTATVVVAAATTQADQVTVSKLRDALASRIPDWKKVTDKVMHRVLPPETDLNMDEIEFDYGYCDKNTFYLYVWTKITNQMRFSDEVDTFYDGFGYVESSTPPDCYPKEMSQVWLRDAGTLGNNWYAVSGAIDYKPTPGG